MSTCERSDGGIEFVFSQAWNFNLYKKKSSHKMIGNRLSSKYSKQIMWKNIFHIITLWARYSGAVLHVIIISLFALKELILLSSWKEVK